MGLNLTLSEETILFYFKTGTALAAWVNVEVALWHIADKCLDGPTDTLAPGYVAIENFRAKLAFVNKMVLARFPQPKLVNKWIQARDRTVSISKARNKLAHYTAVSFPNARQGRRLALCPTVIGPTNLAGQRTPPPGTLALRDIVQVQLRFDAVQGILLNFLALLDYPHPALRQELAEQDIRPPTLAQLKRQIHKALAPPPESSGR